MIEWWFQGITIIQIYNGVLKSVEQPEQAIQEYINHHSVNAKAFVWSKKAEDILAEVTRAPSRTE